MAYLGMTVVFSPDLEEVIEAIGAATETITAAGMTQDPDVQALMGAIVKRLYCGEAFDMVLSGNHAVCSICDDELLDLLAKWQALKRVAITRLQARGWRT